jgi:L-seryl-tRNA(Ser) seleniumtransferase
MINLQTLPSIEHLLQTEQVQDLISVYGRPLTLDALQTTLEDIREQLKRVPTNTSPDHELIITTAKSLLTRWAQPALQPVINATGVILHTNLGRAPLSKATIKAMVDASESYSNLEFDLSTGKRGSRHIHTESVLKKLFNVESAIVVNNNASAILLILSALSSRKRVVIARSQLVEIGGGFRIPDVMKLSGSKLVEIGTTNKVRLADYEQELDSAVLIMVAHRSNFKMTGFTAEPDLKDIADLAHKKGVNVVVDLGSGALLDTSPFGLAHEPTVQETLLAGADIVCFSGDKLLGGPQAGIIIGKAEILTKIKKHPLARAIRADKTCLAGITATLMHYLKNEAAKEIPIWKMISMSRDKIKSRAENWARELGTGIVSENNAVVGGGSLPEESLPSYTLSLTVRNPDRFLRKLRLQDPPLIARTENDKILFDPRTVLPDQDQVLIKILQSFLPELI